MTLNSFIRSSLGAFTKSDLGARNGPSPFKVCFQSDLPGRVSTGGCSASVSGPYRDAQNHTFRITVTDPASSCSTWPTGTTHDVLLFFDSVVDGRYVFKRIPASYNSNAPIGLQVELSVEVSRWTTFQTTQTYNVLVHNGSVGYRNNWIPGTGSGRVPVGSGLSEACVGECPQIAPSTSSSRAMWIRRPDSHTSKTITVVLREVDTGDDNTVILTQSSGTWGSALFDGYATSWSYVGTLSGQQVSFSGGSGSVELRVGSSVSYSGRWRYLANFRDLDSTSWGITSFDDCGHSIGGEPNDWVLVSITES